jgi:hypothetical protein
MADLIDAAKRLAKGGFTPWEDSCHLTCELCGDDFAEDGAQHEPGCPWLAMPAIVAALEAASAWDAFVLLHGKLAIDRSAPLAARAHLLHRALHEALAGRSLPTVSE